MNSIRSRSRSLLFGAVAAGIVAAAAPAWAQQPAVNPSSPACGDAVVDQPLQEGLIGARTKGGSR